MVDLDMDSVEGVAKEVVKLYGSWGIFSIVEVWKPKLYGSFGALNDFFTFLASRGVVPRKTGFLIAYFFKLGKYWEGN